MDAVRNNRLNKSMSAGWPDGVAALYPAQEILPYLEPTHRLVWKIQHKYALFKSASVLKRDRSNMSNVKNFYMPDVEGWEQPGGLRYISEIAAGHISWMMADNRIWLKTRRLDDPKIR